MRRLHLQRLRLKQAEERQPVLLHALAHDPQRAVRLARQGVTCITQPSGETEKKSNEKMEKYSRNLANVGGHWTLGSCVKTCITWKWASRILPSVPSDLLRRRSWLTSICTACDVHSSSSFGHESHLNENQLRRLVAGPVVAEEERLVLLPQLLEPLGGARVNATVLGVEFSRGEPGALLAEARVEALPPSPRAAGSRDPREPLGGACSRGPCGTLCVPPNKALSWVP